MKTKEERDEFLAVVAMDMFCTGNSVDDEIDHYLFAGMGSEGKESVATIESNVAVLQYLEKHVEILMDHVVKAVQEADKHVYG